MLRFAPPHGGRHWDRALEAACLLDNERNERLTEDEEKASGAPIRPEKLHAVCLRVHALTGAWALRVCCRGQGSSSSRKGPRMRGGSSCSFTCSSLPRVSCVGDGRGKGSVIASRATPPATTRPTPSVLAIADGPDKMAPDKASRPAPRAPQANKMAPAWQRAQMAPLRSSARIACISALGMHVLWAR